MLRLDGEVVDEGFVMFCPVRRCGDGRSPHIPHAPGVDMDMGGSHVKECFGMDMI